MLNQGIIEPSQSPWSSPIVLVRKKDGSTRFCVDYRLLNHVTLKDSYPLPRIDDSLDALVNAQWFSTLDLASGYWQVTMDSNDAEKTAFATPTGLFHFRVLPFGLCNAPATFQMLMECVLAGLQWHTCLLCIDDVIVFSQDFDSHLDRLTDVINRIGHAGLKLTPKKCHLFKKEVEFLGHIVSSDGVSTNPEKVRIVQEWPVPENISQLKSFLGLCSYYRRFVQNFSSIARPLNRLAEHSVPFIWDETCQSSFDELKAALTSPPILAYPNSTETFILDTDASNFGIGAVLSQKQNGVERVVEYYSKTLSRSERNYCVTHRELLAIVKGVKHFHHYLYGCKFLIRTDHGSLTWLFNFKEPEGQIARWLQLLSTYDFTIQHRPGSSHKNADALSRRPCKEESCKHCDGQDQREANRINVRQGDDPQILNINGSSLTLLPNKSSVETRKAQLMDPIIGPVLQWKEDREQNPLWSEVSYQLKTYLGFWNQLRILNGILYKKILNKPGTCWQLIVPECFKEEILHSAHDNVTAGHLGIERTLARLKCRFYWSRMADNVTMFYHIKLF